MLPTEVEHKSYRV
jgi:hypothetical protein